MSKTYSYDEVRELVEQIVADDPEHIDPAVNSDTTCMYYYPEFESETDHPRCIVGEWLSRLGVKDETLYDISELGAVGDIFYTYDGPAAMFLADIGHLEISRDAEDFLSSIQTLQDKGVKWRDTLVLFDRGQCSMNDSSMFNKYRDRGDSYDEAFTKAFGFNPSEV